MYVGDNDDTITIGSIVVVVKDVGSSSLLLSLIVEVLAARPRDTPSTIKSTNNTIIRHTTNGLVYHRCCRVHLNRCRSSSSSRAFMLSLSSSSFSNILSISSISSCSFTALSAMLSMRSEES